jgi:sulfur-oxidizing protein SoxZ
MRRLTMGDQIKIRAQNQGDITDIRILMQHPMETGQRKDDKGQTLPTHFIQTFSVSLNGKPIIDGQLNTSISRNPLFTFKARGIKAGDKLSVAWTDNSGDKRQDEITVA